MKSLTICTPGTVHGILDGTITEWWLPMKKQPVDGNDIRILSEGYDLCSDKYGNAWALTSGDHNYEKTSVPFPFKNYNDDSPSKPILFLREAWFPVSPNTRNRWRPNINLSGRMYQADGLQEYYPYFLANRRTGKKIKKYPEPRIYSGKSFSWRPAYTMPEWASRCVVEVEEVRVERRHGKLHCNFSNGDFVQHPWSWIIKFRRVT